MGGTYKNKIINMIKFDKIETPFTKEQVDKLNHFQLHGRFHQFTCKNGGDKAHIKYEFEKEHKGENYKKYLIDEKAKGVNFPDAVFLHTSLIATENGWICPVCDYKQGWAHSFMAE
jgi:hypothetical protein